jgi:hypothetical protein
MSCHIRCSGLVTTLTTGRVWYGIRARSICQPDPLAGYMTFGHDAKHAFSFLNDVDSGIQALVVHLWSSESKVVFYKGSHL